MNKKLTRSLITSSDGHLYLSFSLALFLFQTNEK